MKKFFHKSGIGMASRLYEQADGVLSFLVAKMLFHREDMGKVSPLYESTGEILNCSTV